MNISKQIKKDTSEMFLHQSLFEPERGGYLFWYSVGLNDTFSKSGMGGIYRVIPSRLLRTPRKKKYGVEMLTYVRRLVRIIVIHGKVTAKKSTARGVGM